MTDLDEDYEDEDWGEEYADDEPDWALYEPACWACEDTGNVVDDRDPYEWRPCPSCQPGWLVRAWWRLTDRIRGRWRAWRMRRRAPQTDNEPPF